MAKIKIEVDVNDLLEEIIDDVRHTGEGESRLKNYIISDIERAVTSFFYQKLEKDLKETMSNKVKNMVEEKVENSLNEKVSKFLEEGTVKKDYSNEQVPVEEWIKSCFEDRRNFRELKTAVENKSDLYVKEIKDRYDMLFATQIVQKMNEQGLLKEGIYKSLIE